LPLILLYPFLHTNSYFNIIKKFEKTKA